MTRYSAILLIVAFSAASALAAASPLRHTAPDMTGANETVIEKNQAFPQVGPLEFEDCLNPDCTLTLG
jgi:hypothetical protein